MKRIPICIQVDLFKDEFPFQGVDDRQIIPEHYIDKRFPDKLCRFLTG